MFACHTIALSLLLCRCSDLFLIMASRIEFTPTFNPSSIVGDYARVPHAASANLAATFRCLFNESENDNLEAFGFSRCVAECCLFVKYFVERHSRQQTDRSVNSVMKSAKYHPLEDQELVPQEKPPRLNSTCWGLLLINVILSLFSLSLLAVRVWEHTQVANPTCAREWFSGGKNLHRPYIRNNQPEGDPSSSSAKIFSTMQGGAVPQ